jgi:hypothetical protein
MTDSMIHQYFLDRNKLLNSSKEETDINEFIRKNDLLINFLCQYIDVEKSFDVGFKTDNKSLEKIVSTFRIDATFNKTKSRNWLLVALRMVIIEGWTFNGIHFKKENRLLIKTNIK